jgi:plastocyanin
MRPTFHRVRGFALVSLCLALLTAACASSAQADDQPVQTTSVDMPPSYLYAPAAIAVQAGDTVTWTNHDHFSHNVHLLGAIEWRSEVLPPGESVTYTFAEPGEYAYQCDLHPQDMQGTVTVTAP